MQRKRDHQVPKSTSKSVTRRQMLEGLGALAAVTACSGAEDPVGEGTGATGGAGGSGGQAASGGKAGAVGTGGTNTSGTGGSTAGTGGSSAGSGGTGPTGTAGKGGSGGTGATATGGAAGSTASAGGAGGSGTTGMAGGGAGGTPAGGAGTGGNGGVAGSGGGGGDLVAPPFTDVPMCSASRADRMGQGPFFIHDGEEMDDVSLFRQDIRGRYNMDAEPGIEMQLHLRILDSTDGCTPVPDVEVYIWHTDAQGYYSGFGNRGDQNPDIMYNGVPNRSDLKNPDRFCRGVQTTDANGVVSFRSIYPGWYNGRDLHIHFICLKKDSPPLDRMSDYSKANTQNKWLFTTQFYFEPEFTKSIHETYEPYKRRTSIGAYAGAILADESGNSNLRAAARLEDEIVIAQLQIVLDPA